MPDIDRILDFITSNARLLDRHRAELAIGRGAPEAAVAVLAGYRNADGGFGWALEPDLRAPASQPVAALHAFEVFEEVAPLTSPMAAGLLDWLDAVALPGGAVPFALPGGASAGSAPMWGAADTTSPSLHMTTVVLSIAHRVARHDPAVAGASPTPSPAGATGAQSGDLGRRSATMRYLLVLCCSSISAPIAPYVGSPASVYTSMLTPVPVDLWSMTLSAAGFAPSANSRLPVPSTTG
jgi:hypothetical protein